MDEYKIGTQQQSLTIIRLHLVALFWLTGQEEVLFPYLSLNHAIHGQCWGSLSYIHGASLRVFPWLANGAFMELLTGPLGETLTDLGGSGFDVLFFNFKA